MLDMVLLFNIMVQDRNGVWHANRKRIAINYLTGFFIIDLCSILPFWITPFIFNDEEARASCGLPLEPLNMAVARK